MHGACTGHAHPMRMERAGNAAAAQRLRGRTQPKETPMRRIVTLTLAALSLTTLVACETAEGFGQDVENTGEAIQGAAN